MTGMDNAKYQSGFFTPANQSSLVVQDIDNNGINDLIGQTTMIWYPPISDTSRWKEMPNIQRIGIPVYIKFDSSFNATFYHENLRNPDVLWHQPDFYDQVDLNKDGKKEIINLGEHYHTDYFLGDQDPKAAKNILGKIIMKYLGQLENRDYDLQTARKLSRYYTIENGRLIDKKDNYNYTNLNFQQNESSNISNPKFVSTFGSAFGDMDNDGDIDYVQSDQVDGQAIDVLINDGQGNFSMNRQKTDQYGYDTGPEGKNMLIDINGDGFLDYFFGGNLPILNTNNREGFMGYLLNDKKGKFAVESMTNIGNFGSKLVAPKYMYQVDLDNDKKNEIIVYRSTGLGSGGGGIQGEEFINDILIFSNNNGTLINNTDKFIDTLSRSKMYAQASILYYEDIDGDKIKDMFIRYEIDSAIIKNYSPFTGYWEKNYNGFSYFKGSKEGKFKYTRLGRFILQEGFAKWYNPSEFSGILSNNFQIGDIDNDGTSELIHQPNTGNNLLIFKLYDCPKPTINPSKLSICGTDSVSIKITNKDSFEFAWIVDFPMYEKDSETGKIDFSHNPFSMPQGGMAALDAEDPETILGYQYDLACNGYELISGAIRNHKPEIMYKAFEIAGYPNDEVNKRFGGMVNAFTYGAPPHGGCAAGIDRIVMLLANEDNIRQVIMFPMNQRAEDLMLGGPSEVSNEQLRELNLRILPQES